MTNKEALRTIANTKTNHIKSEKIGQPRIMYLVKEERKKELECIKQDLKRLETLERLVYTSQLENTKDIDDEFGRALTILQNHCMAMEDTKYACDVLVRLNRENEKYKKAFQELRENTKIINDFLSMKDHAFCLDSTPNLKEALNNERI